jgi:pimeloyl-ACP methyl ester carboxylesterase
MDMYADLKHVRMFYELHGTGDPLVLVHGALGGAYAWMHQISEFATQYRVLVPEQRGRGRTPDVEGPLSYQAMADDTIEFLERAAGGRSHIVGASDGGIIGLHMALQRPDLVNRLVIMGANFHKDGLVEEWIQGFSADDEEWAMPRERYAAVSPDGAEHWPIIFAKIKNMALNEPTLTTDDLASISVPVLVMVGDDDIVAHRHTIELYEALPAGQLAVIPGASHVAFMEKPDLVNGLILGFLAEEGPPATYQPIRRSAARRE